MIAEKYEYPSNGIYNETVAVMDDGRRYTVDTQYGGVYPHGEHSDACSQRTKIGGRCDCGLLDGIDVASLVIEARQNGKFGQAPRPVVAQVIDDAPEWTSPRGLTLTEEMDREDTIY